MRNIYILFILIFLSHGSFAQTKVTQSYPVKDGQEIELKFDYPKVVRISTWDKNEIAVEATVKINDGENDKAFSLESANADGKISIWNKLDLDQIPQSYYIIEQGIKKRFNSAEEIEIYKKANSGGNKIVSYQQKDMEITVNIKVPVNKRTSVNATYGMVELVNFEGPINIDAKYGGIDATLNDAKIGKIKLTNRFGKIYTNLDLTPTEKTEQNFFSSITAEPGKGPFYSMTSSFGNIYVRKSVK